MHKAEIKFFHMLLKSQFRLHKRISAHIEQESVSKKVKNDKEEDFFHIIEQNKDVRVNEDVLYGAIRD